MNDVPNLLAEARMQALFAHDEAGRLVNLDVPGGGDAPMFVLHRNVGNNLWRFHADLPDEVMRQLTVLCEREPVSETPSRLPRHADSYADLLSSHGPIKRIWAGPAFLFQPEILAGDIDAIEITGDNVDLLNGGLEAWRVDVMERRPLMAVIADGHAVSICGSSRITDAVHEAGIETLPDYRGQGHATTATAAWAAAITRLGAVPLYSTNWQNEASRGVAGKLRLRLTGVDFHIT